MDRTQEINEYVRRMYSLPIKNGVKNRCYAKYGRPHPEFEDAYQTVVAKVYEYLVNHPELKFHSDGHLATYLLNSVTNLIFDITKSTKYKQTTLYEDFAVNGAAVAGWLEELSEEPTELFTDEEDVEAAAARRQLEAAMAKLRPKYATALQLLADGCSYLEAAEEMGVGLNTYKQYVLRGRQEAKKLLGGKW